MAHRPPVFARIVAGACPLFALALLSVSPDPLEAQIRGSERSQVSQVSDGTKITIDYARPLVRGRTPVFGELVGWDHVWTPGANEATTFEASKDVTLNGIEIPAARYSVWMVPADGDWEVVLDPNDQLYHTQSPEPHDEQIRFAVTPDESAFTEVLTFDFPSVRPDGMDLRFRWAETSVVFTIEVEPTASIVVAAEEAERVVGTYEFAFAGPPPPGAPEGAEPPAMGLELEYDGEHLIGVISGAPPGLPSEVTFVPVAEYVYNPAWMMNGRIMETEVDMYFEFTVEDDQAVGFDVRGLEDRLMMTGQRTN